MRVNRFGTPYYATAFCSAICCIACVLRLFLRVLRGLCTASAIVRGRPS